MRVRRERVADPRLRRLRSRGRRLEKHIQRHSRSMRRGQPLSFERAASSESRNGTLGTPDAKFSLKSTLLWSSFGGGIQRRERSFGQNQRSCETTPSNIREEFIFGQAKHYIFNRNSITPHGAKRRKRSRCGGRTVPGDRRLSVYLTV